MSHTELSESDIEQRLDVLEHNLSVLETAATELEDDGVNGDWAYVSLCQAFAEERQYLQEARHGSLEDRAHLVDDMLSSLSTIRMEADDDVIERIDETVEGSLKNWD